MWANFSRKGVVEWQEKKLKKQHLSENRMNAKKAIYFRAMK